MQTVKLFYALETTGVDERKHGIHQISGFVEVNGFIAETFNFKVAPHPKCLVDPAALKVANVTEEQIRNYDPMKVVHDLFIAMLGKYCDRYSRTDKIWLVGFNNRKFDDAFLRAWFTHNGNDFFGAWFWPDSLDVLVLASQHLLEVRRNMISFKLKAVAKQLGIEVDETKLHDALYDISLTYQIYKIITNPLL